MARRMEEWNWTCPSCDGAALRFEDALIRCSDCGHEIPMIDGVWRFLTPLQQQTYAPFLDTYNRVRVAEGRGEYDADVLNELPKCPAHHAMAWQWRIRAKSFSSLMRLLAKRLDSGSRVLDLGAGNGWLSHQLEMAGYLPCSIDIATDSEDGLGAAAKMSAGWPRVQAEFDRLPLAGDAVDCVIFNASFHYSTCPRTTLGEALRVLRPGGLCVILDTPIYRRETSGRAMLEEQQQYFVDLIGERSDSVSVSGFLTWHELNGLADQFGIDFDVERPYYGVRWALRSIIAALRGQREPAKFAIAWAYNST